MQARISFEDIKFTEQNDVIRANFMKNYYFDIPTINLEHIASFKVDEGELVFECSEKKANNKLNLIIENGLSNLIHKIRNKPTLYIHRTSGIPLMGTNEFGIVDRGTNIIEVKPLTGCNLSCTFCSVEEGKNDKKDILVEEEYIIQELEKIVKIKEHSVEINIGPQGEPLLYPKLVELVRDMKNIPGIETISMNTNGLTLNKNLINELSKAGLDRINLSIHALDKKLASELADGPYNIDLVLDAIKNCEEKIDVLLTPVLIPGKNEQEIGKIIELSKTIKNKKYPVIGIQNYLNYKGGRNITKQMSWDKFYDFLSTLEKRHNVSLLMDEKLFEIKYDKTFPKPFKKGQTILAELISPGRKKNEFLASSQNRCITVLNPKKTKGNVKVKLIRDKHNIFTGITN